MTSETTQSTYDWTDVLMLVGFVFMSLGVAVLAVAYLFTYNLSDMASSAVYSSAREMESAEVHAWTVFTVTWTAGLCLVAVGVVMVTCTFIYTTFPSQCHRVTSSHGDVIPLSGQSRSCYGTSDSQLTSGH